MATLRKELASVKAQLAKEKSKSRAMEKTLKVRIEAKINAAKLRTKSSKGHP